MTRAEAIEVLKRNKPDIDPRPCGVELKEACEVAIESLRQPSADEIIRKCAEAVAYADFCENCTHYQPMNNSCDGTWCAEAVEEYLKWALLK